MARVGISEQQVFEAIEALMDEGQSVSVSRVRDKLGSGSYSTISTHLAKWRAVNDNRQVVDYPDIPDTVDKAFRNVWALAWKESQAGIQAEREALTLSRQQMEQGAKDMESEIARLEAENTAQGDELKKMSETLQKQETALSGAQIASNDLKIENARLDERVKSSESRAGELKEELDKLHARLKEATAAAKGTEKPKAPRKKG